jgi:hypothetical protein
MQHSIGTLRGERNKDEQTCFPMSQGKEEEWWNPHSKDSKYIARV